MHDEDDEYNKNVICISNKVMIRMSDNDRMNCKKLNLKQKWKQKWKGKKHQQKNKYSKKMKMKKKIVTMTMNVTN